LTALAETGVLQHGSEAAGSGRCYPALQSTTIVAQPTAASATFTAISRSSAAPDAPYLAATAHGVSQSASATAWGALIVWSATKSRRKLRSVRVRNLRACRYQRRLDCLLHRLLCVKADDLIRLVDVSPKKLDRTKVRASGPEQPRCLL
jgi:hypothetical protein